MNNEQCQRQSQWLQAFVDKQVAAEIPAQAVEHFESCAHCQAEVTRLRQVKQHLKLAVKNTSVPPGLETRIRARILEEQTSRDWWRLPVFQAALAGVAMLTLTVGLYAMAYRPMRQQIAQVLGIGLADHVHCTLERKNPPAGQLNRPLPGHHSEIVSVAQNALPGFTLMESHYCRFNGRVFTHIVFGKEAQRVSVIVTRKDSGESLPKVALLAKMRASGIPVYATISSTGLAVAALETEQSWGYVVSDLNESVNQRVMAAIATSIVNADRP